MESSIEQNISFDYDSSIQAASSVDQTLPEEIPDTFRMSIDHVSIIGENVIVGDREISTDSINTVPTEFPISSTPDLQKPETPVIDSPGRKLPPILDTSKCTEEVEETVKPQKLLKLSLTRHDDVFVKPSPLAEIMSPAKMLQFEIDIATSSTPTMKRAAIDFNFFNKNNFEEYFTDLPKDVYKSGAQTEGEAFMETPVIVKANTVRLEIGYGMKSNGRKKLDVRT